MKRKVCVLFGCPDDPELRYQKSGYIAFDEDGKPQLCEDISKARRYRVDVKDGKGSPKDWAKMLSEDYGFRVHPIVLKKKEEI